MTENQMDGGSEEGTVTDANGDASGNQSVQQPSFDAAKLQSTFDAFGATLEELNARVNGLQSVKDKQDNKLTGLEGKIAEYEQLVEKVGSKEGALAQMKLQEQLTEMNQALQELRGSASTQPPGTGASGAVNAAKTFAEMGLDLKDPQVAVEMAKSYQSEDAVIAAGYKLSQKFAHTPAPTQAQGAALQGGSPKKEDVETLTSEYQTEMANAQGNPSLARSIKAKYKEKGVPVDSVVFH